MDMVRSLRIFSKLSILFALVVSISKVLVQPEYQLWIHGGEVQMVALIAMVVNLLFNIFLFIGASLIFSALARILERLEGNGK